MRSPPLPLKLIPIFDKTGHEEILPNVRSKSPVVQLEAISMSHITCLLGKETDTATSFQAAEESKKASSRLSMV